MNNTTSKKNVDYWLNEYWPELQKATFDSEEKQEKYVFTISTGAVGLLLGTMGFGTKPEGIYYALIALGLFTLSMLSCVIYHIIAKTNHTKQFKMIRDFVSNLDKGDSEIRDQINKSNFFLDWWSIVAIFFIFVGIILFTIYLIKNLM